MYFNLDEEIQYKFGCYGLSNTNGIFYIGGTNPPNNINDRIFGFKTEIYYKGSNEFRTRGHSVDLEVTLNMIINNNVRFNYSTHNGSTKKHYCLDYQLNNGIENWDGFINWFKISKMWDTIMRGEKINVTLLNDGDGSKEKEQELILEHQPYSNIEFSKDFDEKFSKHDEECRKVINNINSFNKSMKEDYIFSTYPMEKTFTI